MKYYLILPALFNLICLVGCTGNKPKLSDVEKKFGTDGEGRAVFHPVAEQDGGLGLKFPGYLIGIEQTNRTRIGRPGDFDEQKNIDDFKKPKESNDEERDSRKIRKILSRPQRTFVSHIAEYSLVDNEKYITEDIFYNIYDKRFGMDPQIAYKRGKEALDKLRKKVQNDVAREKEKKTPYTHIILYCMGWNADQQECLRNYNSLLSQMRNAHKSPDIFEYEFDQGVPEEVQSLIKKTELYAAVKELNKLLKDPNLYNRVEIQEALKQKKLQIKGSKFQEAEEEINKLSDKTKEYRKKSFSELSDKEQEAIKWLNRSLLEFIYPQIPKKKVYMEKNPFRPLFIGISWPSELRFSSWWWFIGDIRKYFSYSSKADDADEVGLLWANKVLWDILVPIRRTERIPLMVMGHSFGARIITRAVFSKPPTKTPAVQGVSETSTKNAHDIDLVLGLQGAFSINRFIPGEGKEGSPYKDFRNKKVGKFIFTWSEHDFANPIAYWFSGEEHIGGVYGYAKSYVAFDKKTNDSKKDNDKNDIFDHFEIEVEEGLLNSYDVRFKEVQLENEFKKDKVWFWRLWKITEGVRAKFVGDEWNKSFYEPKKISIVDASALIKNKPYGKGGIAHNDIYTPGVAMFVWDCIKRIDATLKTPKNFQDIPPPIE